MQAHHDQRVHLAVVDGKHSYEEVAAESVLLSTMQEPGDIIFFDDMQIAGVREAVTRLRGYDIELLSADASRRYAIARKR